MSEKKILHFEGLYGDLSYRKKEGYIFLELIKTRSESFDWKINPHVHSHLCQVFCIESGAVQLQTSDSIFILQPPAIVVIPSGTLHGLQYNPTVRGYILTLSDTVFESLFSATASVMLHFDSLKILSFVWQKKEFRKLIQVIELLNKELFNQENEKKVMIESLLRIFFISLQRNNEAHKVNAIPYTNQTLLYYRHFLRLIKLGNNPITIPAYAKQVGISAVHLNRVCRQVCNKSALTVVQELLIEKSKSYLTHTNKSIAEIAYQLHFEYPGYFARLFKKLNGISPKEYRKSRR